MTKHKAGLWVTGLGVIGLAAAAAAPAGAQVNPQSQQPNQTDPAMRGQTPQTLPGTLDPGQTASGSVTGQSPEMKVNRDEEFLKKAARGDVKEVHMARMAADRSTNQAVKDFARRLETDHTKAAQQVASIAQGKGLTVAAVDSGGSSTGSAARSTEESGTTSSSGASTSGSASTPASAGRGYGHMGKLGNLSGEQFDREFVKKQVADHQKDIKEYERASNDSRLSSDVRNMAQQTLPTLREHLQTAKSLEGQLSGSSGGPQPGSSTKTSGTTGRVQ
mgnify:CR=1 FL=1